MKLNKRVLILGASSDIGLKVTKKFIDNKWYVDAHFAENKKAFLNIKSKKLKLIKLNFKNLIIQNDKTFFNNFSKEYACIINLIGHIDNKSFFDICICL